MSLGSSTNSFQTNEPTANVRGENLAPATDPYSYYNRLCELFPDIHPPHLQRVFDECGRNFLRTIDNVLYARRFRKSIMTQMSKFRSQQRNQPPNNFSPNPHQQKDQDVNNPSQVHVSQLAKPGKQPRQSPKPYPNAKNATNLTVKKNRILAYQPLSSHQVNSTRRGCITSPNCNQTTQSPGNSLKQCTSKCSTPPPNVFVHQIDMGQQVSGSGDATSGRKLNQGYFFSYKKPSANVYGPLPQPSSHVSMPMSSGDLNSFHTPLPPPYLPFCPPQQFTSVDWFPVVPGRSEPLETPQQQQEQNNQQNINDDRTSMSQHLTEQGHVPGERNLEAPQQVTEQEPTEWACLLKNILDPVHSVDSNNSNGMIRTPQMESGEIYGTMNQNKQGSGNFMFKTNFPPGYSFVSNSLGKQSQENCDISQIEDTVVRQAIKLGDSSVHGSLPEQINVTDLNEESGMNNSSTSGQMKPSPSVVMNGARQSLVFQCGTDLMEQAQKSDEGTSDIQLPERDKSQEANESDFSNEDQLVIDTSSWLQNADN